MSVMFAGRRLSLLVLAVLFTSTFAQPKYRAVNLGGWLVIESYLTPGLFEGLPESVQTEADISSRRPDKIKEHRSTFVTEEDFSYLQSHGINAVRIPVGWWIAQSITPSPYVDGSLQALDKAFDWASKHGIKVIVDLHSARGSQNKDSHSGSSNGVCSWSEHVPETVQDIGFLAERYGRHPALLGIELLNEPNSECVSKETLKNYYNLGHKEVRKYNSETYVIFSSMLGPGTSEDQAPDLVTGGQSNVVLDIHLYSVFEGTQCYKQSAQETIACIYNDLRGTVRSLNAKASNIGASVLVGEWANVWHATDGSIKSLSQAQREVYGEASFGWAYWTLKHTSPKPIYKYWSFQNNIADGVF